jgi:hypothetical protein
MKIIYYTDYDHSLQAVPVLALFAKQQVLLWNS